MIIYKDILARLKDAGYSTYRLQKEKILGQETVSKIRYGKPINIRTIDTICKLLDCQPGEILEYRKDEVTEK